MSLGSSCVDRLRSQTWRFADDPQSLRRIHRALDTHRSCSSNPLPMAVTWTGIETAIFARERGDCIKFETLGRGRLGSWAEDGMYEVKQARRHRWFEDTRAQRREGRVRMGLDGTDACEGGADFRPLRRGLRSEVSAGHRVLEGRSRRAAEILRLADGALDSVRSRLAVGNQTIDQAAIGSPKA